MTIWLETDEAFPTPPAHPFAERVHSQLERVKVLLHSWRWSEYEGRLYVVVRFKVDGTTLRLIVGDGDLNADVYVATVEPSVRNLVWLLHNNNAKRWKSRASVVEGPEGQQVQVYLEAFFPHERVDDLATVLWHGLEQSWTWRGQFVKWDLFPPS